MYLDNILLSKSAGSDVSYSEILMDCIETSEAICASEAYAISSEFARHTLGSEAASDWWPKIKAFFHKIWENLKRIIAKMAAWMASLPAKIIALCKKIYTMWVKRGVEGRVTNLRKNLSKKLVHLDDNAANSFKQTDWGIHDPDIVSEAVDAVDKKLQEVDVIRNLNLSGEKREGIKKLIKGFAGVSSSFDASAIDGVIDAAALMAINPEEDSNFDPKAAIKETVLAAVQNTIVEIVEKNRADENEVTIENIEEWFSQVKNDKIAKDYEKFSKKFTRIIEYLDRKHKNASKEFDALYKENNEDGVKALVARLKIMNKLTAAVIVADGFFAKLYASCALNTAKMLNGAIKCYVSGKDSGGQKPNKQQSIPPAPNPAARASSLEHSAEVDFTNIPSKDPDFAAFLKM